MGVFARMARRVASARKLDSTGELPFSAMLAGIREGIRAVSLGCGGVSAGLLGGFGERHANLALLQLPTKSIATRFHIPIRRKEAYAS